MLASFVSESKITMDIVKHVFVELEAQICQEITEINNHLMMAVNAANTSILQIATSNRKKLESSIRSFATEAKLNIDRLNAQLCKEITENNNHVQKAANATNISILQIATSNREKLERSIRYFISVAKFNVVRLDTNFPQTGDYANIGSKNDKEVKLKLDQKDPKAKKQRKFRLARHSLKEQNNEIDIKIQDFECNECHKKYKCKSSLKVHVEMVHRNIKNFKCDLCTYASYHKCQFKKHMAIHSKDKEATSKKSNCALPSKSLLTNNDNVQQHQGTTQYVCHMCGKVFQKESLYTKHLYKAVYKPCI